jgi:hypothetical protein
MRRLVSAPGPMNAPTLVRVQADGRGRPAVVAGERVELVRRDWLHRFAWWTEHPVCRRYYEVITTSGRRVVVFHDLQTGRWFSQKA